MADDDFSAVLAEAATAGLAAEAVQQAITTAMALVLWADFTSWRTWCDEHGFLSGPRTEDQFRLHGLVLAAIAEGLS